MEIGKEYRVRHMTKGVFDVRISELNETWATGEITSGKAKAILPDNVKIVGDTITMRREFLLNVLEMPATSQAS